MRLLAVLSLLTRRPNMSPSAALSARVARHQRAAVATLQQVLITQSTRADRAAFRFNIILLGASNRARIGVAAFDKGLPLPASRALIRALFEALRATYLVAGLIILFLFQSLAVADVYKFKDTEGRTLLTNIPSKGKGMKLVKRFHFSYGNPHSGGPAPVLKVLKERIKKYKPIIVQAAKDTGLDEDFIHAIILAESAYKPKAVSPKGAMGLMQLMPATAERFNVTNAFDPAQNIRGGTTYLKLLMERFDNDLELAAAAYNAGEGAVEKYGRTIPPYKETQLYVKKVKDFMQQGMVAFN